MLKMPLEGQGKISTYFFKGKNIMREIIIFATKINSATLRLSVISAFLCSLFENVRFLTSNLRAVNLTIAVKWTVDNFSLFVAYVFHLGRSVAPGNNFTSIFAHPWRRKNDFLWAEFYFALDAHKWFHSSKVVTFGRKLFCIWNRREVFGCWCNLIIMRRTWDAVCS